MDDLVPGGKLDVLEVIVEKIEGVETNLQEWYGEYGFLHHDRLIYCRTASDSGHWMYRFGDTQMRTDEDRYPAMMVQEGRLRREEKTEKRDCMGHILTVSV